MGLILERVKAPAGRDAALVRLIASAKLRLSATGPKVKGMDPSTDGNEGPLGALHDLERHPEGLVAAIGDDGLIVPMPQSVAVPGSRVIRQVRSIVHIVAPEDRATAIETYDLARARGTARTQVHLASPSRQLVRLVISDAREEHGVFLAVVVAQSGSVGDLEIGELRSPPPRVGWARKNATGTLLAVDEAMSHMFGWQVEELVGRRSLDLVHPDDHEKAIDSFVQMLASPGQGLRARFRHLCADRTWKWVEVNNTNLLDDPGAGYVLTEVLDISDEMAALEQLRARERLLRRLAEALPTGVLQVDRQENLVYANKRAGQVLGVAEGATATERFGAVSPKDRARLRAALSEALGQGTDCDLEVEMATSPGFPRRCEVAIRVLTADDASVTGALICATDVTDGARLRAELERRATTDMPTGCRNRNWVMARLTELVESCDDLAVIFVDLDDFKSVNDRFGHAAGDQVLTTVAERLRGAVRASDVVGRVGGDEFLVICPDAGGLAGATCLAERVAHAVDQHCPVRGDLGPVRASVGTAYVGGRRISADQLIAEADAAMYAAKALRHAAGHPPRATGWRPELQGDSRR
jgi:diguanylate cyclase (GGDEF)-like protein/PAS domain S-box-containing protein